MAEKIFDMPGLDASSNFFSYFFENNASAMWIYNVDTFYFLEVNKATVALYGYTKDEFLLMTIMDIRPVEDIVHVKQRIAEVGPTASSDKRWRHFKKDGTSIWVTVSSFALIYKGMPARLLIVNDATKYSEQEMALHLAIKELEEYRTAITSGSIVSVTNPWGVIEYVNENFITLNGYGHDELIGQSHNIVSSGRHPKSFWKDMWDTVLGGTSWRGEICNRKKAGELYWVDCFVIPVRNDKNQIDRIFSIQVDITESKHKELEVSKLNRQLTVINKELTESKKELEKLSLVAKFTASEVMIIDKDKQIIWVNDAFTRSTGYTLAEAYGKNPRALLLGPNSSPEASKLIDKAMQSSLPFRTEVVHYTKYGREYYLITDGQPVFDADGNLTQYVLVETDITEMKEKQQAVINSEIKLNAFFSSMANLHLLVDKDLRILAQNDVARAFAQQVQQNMAEGDYLPAKLPQPIRDNFIKLANEAIKGHPTINRYAEIVVADVMLVWQMQYLPAYDRSGNIVGCAFTAADITERKKAEEKLNRQNEIFREIAWKQSHMVRAPLANILAITTLLENTADESLTSALKHESEKLDDIIKEVVKKTIEAKMYY